MPGLPTSEFGVVSRGLPQPAVDGVEREQRLGRYGSAFAEVLTATKHGVCDEGSYFTAADSAGRATAAAPTAFSATAPLLLINNTDVASNPAAKRIYLDYIRAVETSAGTAGVSFFLQVVIDVQPRFSSGGTLLAPLNTNQDTGIKSVGNMYVLPTTVAATVSARTIVGNAGVLPTVTAPIGINSEWCAYFGGDGAKFGTVNGAFGWAGSSLCPVIIGPQQCAVISFLIGSQSATSSWQCEAGWWER